MYWGVRKDILLIEKKIRRKYGSTDWGMRSYYPYIKFYPSLHEYIRKGAHVRCWQRFCICSVSRRLHLIFISPTRFTFLGNLFPVYHLANLMFNVQRCGNLADTYCGWDAWYWTWKKKTTQWVVPRSRCIAPLSYITFAYSGILRAKFRVGRFSFYQNGVISKSIKFTVGVLCEKAFTSLVI